MSAPLVKLTKKDFISDQEVRWCPGCADFAILAGVQKLMPELGIAREKTVFVSGIGCSSRFPYYMNTYGFHGIHGRAPAIATGLKMANPDLTVWMVTGDGDGLSIGGNHLIHALRRNIDLKILLFDNRIYGLTKGQASPTSELGKKTKSSPFGTVDRPFNPLTLALGAGATFVARTTANDMPHMMSVLKRAASHKGAAFVEIWQNCVVFNDGAFDEWSEKDVRDERLLKLEHGKPLVYGKGKDKGLRIGGGFTLEQGGAEGAVLHDESRDNLSLALALASLEPPWPQVMGVLRAVDLPTVDQLAREQEREAEKAIKGPATLEALLQTGDTWDVSGGGGDA
jgi:2-oxoglutarate/2-oxoacid ferredoxin oxidoreductase subunit beta